MSKFQMPKNNDIAVFGMQKCFIEGPVVACGPLGISGHYTFNLRDLAKAPSLQCQRAGSCSVPFKPV